MIPSTKIGRAWDIVEKCRRRVVVGMMDQLSYRGITVETSEKSVVPKLEVNIWDRRPPKGIRVGRFW